MTTEYGRYAPISPRTMSQNRNSAISSPRTRQPAGTNTGLTDPGSSSVRKAMNVPTPTAPQGHRQTPYGGKISTMATGAPPLGGYRRQSTGPAGPTLSGTDDTYQQQLATMNRIRNRGEYGSPIERGNPQGRKPVSIYQRPSQGMRY